MTWELCFNKDVSEAENRLGMGLSLEECLLSMNQILNLTLSAR